MVNCRLFAFAGLGFKIGFVISELIQISYTFMLGVMARAEWNLLRAPKDCHNLGQPDTNTYYSINLMLLRYSNISISFPQPIVDAIQKAVAALKGKVSDKFARLMGHDPQQGPVPPSTFVKFLMKGTELISGKLLSWQWPDLIYQPPFREGCIKLLLWDAPALLKQGFALNELIKTKNLKQSMVDITNENTFFSAEEDDSQDFQEQENENDLIDNLITNSTDSFDINDVLTVIDSNNLNNSLNYYHIDDKPIVRIDGMNAEEIQKFMKFQQELEEAEAELKSNN